MLKWKRPRWGSRRFRHSSSRQWLRL